MGKGNIAGELTAESFPFKDVTWKVRDFFDLPTENDSYVESPPFPFADATWCLRLLPNGGEEDGTTGYVDILVLRQSSRFPRHRVCYKLGFKTRRGKEYQGREYITHFSAKRSVGGIIFYLERSELVDKKDMLVPDGAVTVFCHMHVVETSQTELGEASPALSEPLCQGVQEETPSVKNLQSDYKKLLKSGEDSDVCFVVSGKEFRAHRCILRARSPVFDAMFNHETEEKESGKVVIDDLESGSFMDFLEHVYTGHVEVISDENVFGLYTAADKYDAQTLKSECLEYMQRTLSVDTFCDIMTLALRYQEKELMELAVHFFKKNLTKIIVTVKWQVFLSGNSTRANELLIKALVPEEKKTMNNSCENKCSTSTQ